MSSLFTVAVQRTWSLSWHQGYNHALKSRKRVAAYLHGKRGGRALAGACAERRNQRGALSAPAKIEDGAVITRSDFANPEGFHGIGTAR